MTITLLKLKMQMGIGIYFIILRLFLGIFFDPTQFYTKNISITLPSIPEANEVFTDIGPYNLSYKTFLIAYEGYSNICTQYNLARDSILTIIDYSKPSDQERLFIFDLKNRKLLYSSLVAHGKGSGEIMALSFSNQLLCDEG